MFELLGENNSDAVKDANDVFSIEIFLADSSRKLEDLRDPYTNYNKMSVAGLESISPSVNWKEILNKTGAKMPDSLVVGQPEFYKALSAAIDKFNLSQWKAYLRWHLINAFATRLSSPFEDENFHFKGTIMSGIKEQRPRWKRVQDAVEASMGELL